MSEPWLPLAGIHVVDFSMFVPGPFASSILADLGADVIKVEPPRGDPGRSYVPVQFNTENRNKRSLALDLKQGEAADVVRGLLAVLQKVYSGQRAPEILAFDAPAFWQRLGLDRNLTTGRRNGLGAMVERLRDFAAGLAEPKENL